MRHVPVFAAATASPSAGFFVFAVRVLPVLILEILFLAENTPVTPQFRQVITNTHDTWHLCTQA